MLTRRSVLTRFPVLAALTGATTLAGVGYATAVEPRRVRLTAHALTPAGWPAGLRLRVVMLADFHAHPRNMGEDEIRAVVARANALCPDVTVLLGDYGSQSPGPVPPETVARLASGLRAARGVYAVQGNHDWHDDGAAMRAGHGPTRVERAFRGAGIPFLENACVPLVPEAGLWLAGIESEATPSTQRAARRAGVELDVHRALRLAETLAPVPAQGKAVLLAHEPDIFATDLDPRVVLTLSGHTHGGQVRVLGWSPFIPSRYGLRYAYGHVRERGRDLVVSAGLGSHFVAGRPVRFGIPPEIVVVDLGRAAEVG